MAKAGRPKGTKKPPTISFHRRVKPEFAIVLDKVLKDLKADYENTMKKYL